MAVLVSTERHRLLAIGGGGFVLTIAFVMATRHLSGMVGFLARVLAVAVAALTVAYLVAVLVEGTIDRRRRSALARRLTRREKTAASKRRCGHCRRPLITIDGVSVCPYCDQ